MTNGLGGYSSGTISGDRHAALPRSARRGASGADRAHGDAQSRRRADSAAVRSGARRSIPIRPPRSGGAATTAAQTAMTLVEFRLDLGLPIWRFEGDGFVDRETRADAVSAEHGPPDVSARRSGRAGPARDCDRSCTSATTKARSPIALPHAYALTATEGGSRSSPGAGSAEPASAVPRRISRR